jgi:hypothetical protein
MTARPAALLTALLVSVAALAVYLLLPSRAPNPDGLRVFPAMHRVVLSGDGSRAYQARPWTAAYHEPNLFRANVQKHVLFPLYAAGAFQISRLLGSSGSGLRALQVANALSAAVAVGLAATLIVLSTGSTWVALACGAGLAGSTAFCSMATDIAEVVPALPLLAFGLLLLSRRAGGADCRASTSVPAGISLGLSTACYFAGALVTMALVLALVFARARRTAGTIAATAAATVAIVHCGVFVLAGHRSVPELARALLVMPEQGTYGGLQVTDFGAVLFGFANSLYPVLPDDFGGLRQLVSQLRTGAGSLALLGVPAVAALAAVMGVAMFRARNRLKPGTRRLAGTGVAVLLGALVCSLAWDPYHAKLWAFSNLGLWLVAAAFLSVIFRACPARRILVPGGAAVLLAALLVANTAMLIRRNGSNPKWAAAEAVSRRVSDGSQFLLIGGWEAEFGYLSLMLPESSLLTLPDLILEAKRDRCRFETILDARVPGEAGFEKEVFVLNLFAMSPGQLRAQYGRRLEYPRVQAWLDRNRARARMVMQDCPGGVALHQFMRASPESCE